MCPPLTTPLNDTTTPYADHTFSQEIFDTIIDHLHLDKPTLSLCCTVCKSWLLRCRYHLFFEVNITPKLVEFLCSSPHAQETIAPCINTAALGGAWSSAQREEYDQVISLLLNLDGVHSLSIETWSWDFLSLTSKNLILTANGCIFNNITRLHLQYFRFPSFSVLVTATAGFTMLEDLSFDNVTWELADPPPLTLAPTDRMPMIPRHLQRLHIRSSPINPLLNWLFGHTVDPMDSQAALPQPIHTLILPDLLPNDIYIVGCLLRTLESTLRHFEVGFLVHNYDNSDMRNLSDVIDFSYNRGLRTLRLHHLTLYQFPPSTSLSPTSPVSWLVPLLSNISSPLTELSFHMWMSQEAHLDLIDWPALSSLLGKPSFSGVDTFQFRVLGLREGRDDLKNWLVARLSAWQAYRSQVVEVIFL